MADMTTDADIVLEKYRQPSGQFGAHVHSAPEQSLDAPTPPAVSVPGIITHDVEERGRFGRTRTKTHIVPTALRVFTVHTDGTEDGERGERIISGQAYLPALRDGEHAPADQEALVALGRHATARLPKLTGTVDQATRQADYYLNQHPQAGVIIDGMLWVRASHANTDRF